MRPYVEHVNLTVRNPDEAIRLLTTAVPEFHVRLRGVTDGARWNRRDRLAFSQAVSQPIADATGNAVEGSGFNQVGIVVTNAAMVARALTRAG